MSAPHLVKIEDHEGTGVCGHCSREGLRWIAVLSDGSAVGVECAKKVMGWKPTPKSYQWVAGLTAVAEHSEYRQTFVLWEAANGRTVESMNGSLTQVGGVRERWARRGWAA